MHQLVSSFCFESSSSPLHHLRPHRNHPYHHQPLQQQLGRQTTKGQWCAECARARRSAGADRRAGETRRQGHDDRGVVTRRRPDKMREHPNLRESEKLNKKQKQIMSTSLSWDKSAIKQVKFQTCSFNIFVLIGVLERRKSRFAQRKGSRNIRQVLQSQYLLPDKHTQTPKMTSL